LNVSRKLVCTFAGFCGEGSNWVPQKKLGYGECQPERSLPRGIIIGGILSILVDTRKQLLCERTRVQGGGKNHTNIAFLWLSIRV
jgi:hypothetical protein